MNTLPPPKRHSHACYTGTPAQKQFKRLITIILRRVLHRPRA